MTLYLRYTKNLEKDIDKGCSYHYTGMSKREIETASEVAEALNIDENEIEYNEEAAQWVMPLPGLCAFEMDSDNLEDAIEEAKVFDRGGIYNSESMPFWHIVEGVWIDDCPEGEVIIVTKVLHTNK